MSTNVEIVDKPESQEEIDSTMGRSKRKISEAQYSHLERARAMKAQKREIKLLKEENYTKELKSLYGHIDHMNTNLGSLQTLLTETLKRFKNESNDTPETPPTKKQKTEKSEENGDDAKPSEDDKKKVIQNAGYAYPDSGGFVTLISQALGASLAAGCLMILKYKYQTLYGENSHLNKYDYLR